MSIDPRTEKLLTLGQACKAFPPSGVSTATLGRWIQRGVRGARLETILRGGRRFTSTEAIARFMESQNASTLAVVEITESQRGKQNTNARQALAKMGV